MLSTPDCSIPAALAATLLGEWEVWAHPLPSPAYPAARAAQLARLTPFSAHLLGLDDLNVDVEDARTVLRHVYAFGLGHAEATGFDRAARLGTLLAAELQVFPPAASLPRPRPTAALLSLLSGPRHELEMDELTEILETVQHTLLMPDTEIIFGHSILPEAEEVGLLAWLLVGYRAE